MAHAENKDLLKAAKEAVKKSRTKRALDRMKKSGSSTSDIFKSYGKYDGKPIELKKGGRAGFEDGGIKIVEKKPKAWITKKSDPKWITKKSKAWITKKSDPKWITKKPKEWITKKSDPKWITKKSHTPVLDLGDAKKKGGRAPFQGGGRTNLLEELGRVEGERSNRNRRAEVSRIHGELNKGYSLGGRVGAAKRGFNKKILRKD